MSEMSSKHEFGKAPPELPCKIYEIIKQPGQSDRAADLTRNFDRDTPKPVSIARELLIFYLLILLVPVTMVILPPASGLWWLLKGLGAFIGMATIGHFLFRPGFHRNVIGGAYGGFLLLLVVYGCALVFRDSSFGVFFWAVSVIMPFFLYRQILETVKKRHNEVQPKGTAVNKI